MMMVSFTQVGTYPLVYTFIQPTWQEVASPKEAVLNPFLSHKLANRCWYTEQHQKLQDDVRKRMKA